LLLGHPTAKERVLQYKQKVKKKKKKKKIFIIKRGLGGGGGGGGGGEVKTKGRTIQNYNVKDTLQLTYIYINF